MLLRLPNEILREVIIILGYQNFPDLAPVCKAVQDLLKRRDFWQYYCQKYHIKRNKLNTYLKSFKRYLRDYWQWDVLIDKKWSSIYKFEENNTIISHNLANCPLSDIKMYCDKPLTRLCNSVTFLNMSNCPAIIGIHFQGIMSDNGETIISHHNERMMTIETHTYPLGCKYKYYLIDAEYVQKRTKIKKNVQYIPIISPMYCGSKIKFKYDFDKGELLVIKDDLYSHAITVRPNKLIMPFAQLSSFSMIKLI